MENFIIILIIILMMFSVLHWIIKGFKCKKCYSSKVIIREDLDFYYCLNCNNIADYNKNKNKN